MGLFDFIFGKKEEQPVPAAPVSEGATAPAIPGPYTSAAGRRRRHRKMTKKAGRRHKKHSRRA